MKPILIVDDRTENLYLLRALLQGNGYVVEEAHNGEEALAAARRNLPLLIISDLLMPVMDGYTLLRHWNADERLRTVPFVVYTATYTDPRDERLAMDLGAAAFILKPSEPEPFLARIREVLHVDDSRDRRPSPTIPMEETELLKEYSEVLVRKLEKRAMQLEQANRALLEDIAERKRAEERVWLQASLLDQVRNAVLATDRKGSVLYWNRYAETLFQLQQDEAIDRNLFTLIFPETNRPCSEDMLATVDRVGHWEGDCTLQRKDGTTFPALLFYKTFNDLKGNPSGFVCVAIDNTERNKLEEQFRQAQKMEVVGKFAGGVAHDFNNLLTVINGCAELVSLSIPEDDPSHELIQEIAKAGERAAMLTRQLLSFSRQEFLAPRVLDINQVLHECEKMLRRLIGEDVTFSVKTEPALFPIRADCGQLEQVLLNLVVNARDAMPRGGRLTVQTRNARLPRPDDSTALLDFAVLEVTDTGVGMDAAIQARIFQPFFTTKGNRGTGLGLATVNAIVEKAGGRIEVVSFPGQGSTFRIFLPRVESALLSDALQPAIPSTTANGDETILLAEDEESVRNLVCTLLRSLGYAVLAASRGQEATAIANRHSGPIHLLVTDVVMPEMSGRELAESLLALRPELKVLYLSGYTDDALLRHGVTQAEVAFLQKPFNFATLAAKVREVLDAPGKWTN